MFNSTLFVLSNRHMLLNNTTDSRFGFMIQILVSGQPCQIIISPNMWTLREDTTNLGQIDRVNQSWRPQNHSFFGTQVKNISKSLYRCTSHVRLYMTHVCTGIYKST